VPRAAVIPHESAMNQFYKIKLQKTVLKNLAGGKKQYRELAREMISMVLGSSAPMKEASMSLAENGEALAAPSFIDGGRLYDFIVSGAGNIILNERSLNRINVFPVADGDTGTNLALTMRTIISKAVRNVSVGPTMDSISRIAIENAYGNSGMIFAQFLHGFADAVHHKEKLTLQEFAESSAHAVSFAYKAVAVPKEGTILTVMREWTEELKRFLNPGWIAPSGRPTPLSSRRNP
jgi:hypothetical protein